eukprot:TRINITY_DN12789_c0_g1_i3.p1 TRINITY_DN12789_c0_g1~~TRINITY_DN12789_c0_g1_i3.p1  ORF type:complete len:149 (-),score=33.49 TRINITY_DN12789_c0_g1_i3:64-510(-)
MSVAAPVRVGISAALPRVGAAVRAATNAADSTKASVQYQIAVPGEVVLAKAIIESRQGGVSGTVQRLEEDEDWAVQPPLTEDVVQLLNSNVSSADLPQVDVLNRRHTADEINEAIRQEVMSRPAPISVWPTEEEEADFWCDWKKQVIY